MNNYLEHHGIKGMKWGVRRTDEQLGNETKSSAQTGTSSAPPHTQNEPISTNQSQT